MSSRRKIHPAVTSVSEDELGNAKNIFFEGTENADEHGKDWQRLKNFIIGENAITSLEGTWKHRSIYEKSVANIVTKRKIENPFCLTESGSSNVMTKILQKLNATAITHLYNSNESFTNNSLSKWLVEAMENSSSTTEGNITAHNKQKFRVNKNSITMKYEEDTTTQESLRKNFLKRARFSLEEIRIHNKPSPEKYPRDHLSIKRIFMSAIDQKINHLKEYRIQDLRSDSKVDLENALQELRTSFLESLEEVIREIFSLNGLGKLVENKERSAGRSSTSFIEAVTQGKGPFIQR